MPSQYPNKSTVAETTTLSRLYQLAVGQQWPLALYRLPGEQAPICTIQTNGTLKELTNPWDSLGMTGFVMAPWIGEKDMPSILIQPTHTLQDWNPDIDLFNGLAKEYNAVIEKPEPTNTDIPFEGYQHEVASIQSAITQGTIEKAILSRIVSHELSEDFDAVTAFQHAAQQYPNAYCYLVNLPGIGQWMGASPEVLMSVQGHQLSTVALAGTKPDSSLTANGIAWGIKEQHEHDLVRSHILKELEQHAEKVQADGPNTIQAGNLYHLRTDFTAQLPTDNSLSALKQLLQAMHPTPAISGTPKEAAIQVIAKTEKHQRAYYAGFIGPINGVDDIRLFVNLRCMRILPNKALLYVGGGITAGSNAEEEWQETQAKARTLLNVLG